MTTTHIYLKKSSYSWDEVCVSVYGPCLTETQTRNWSYCAYFNDKYLSEEDVLTKKAIKDASYLMLTPQRIESLLKLYNKRIEIINYREDLMWEMIVAHNNSLNTMGVTANK